MTIKGITLKALHDMGKPIYAKEPYVALSTTNIVMFAGTLDEILEQSAQYGSYYDTCTVQIRQYDLHLHDNTRLPNATKEAK